GMVKGERAHLAGLNIVGLERRGFTREGIHALRSAYRMLFASEGTMAERLDDVSDHYKDQKLVTDVVAFIRDRGNRPLCQPQGEA
ncbi:MAG: acyl-[acyl-carrier-protein]--UDP-N-acetylglucosamine O-acyltransferase, partial [Alphaproteobacteria bacterium]|nr:acyl-[acyl-carrier-protein]--UDP-N-acetylglucosamine O-acyltransferase [Alphaproteobacteria bacterium]